MPCVVRAPARARKTVKLVGANSRQKTVPGQITVGKAFLVDDKENFISHAFEACLLSSARTGICPAIAMGLLSKRRSKVAVLGAGRVGYYAASLGGVELITVADIDRARADKAVELLSNQAPGVEFREAPAGPVEPEVWCSIVRPWPAGTAVLASASAEDCSSDLLRSGSEPKASANSSDAGSSPAFANLSL